MIKIIGAIMIIASTSFIGFLKALTYKNRLVELYEFQKGIELFETEVRFTKSPLSEAFNKIADNLSGEVSKIFKKFSISYISSDGQTASVIWNETILNNINNLNLTNDDLNIIRDFGVCLGTLDAEGQINSISSVVSRIESQIETVRGFCNKNAKLYQSLGVYSGILISVLLI